MAFDTGTLTRSTDDSADSTARYTGHLQAFVFALFFAFGGITSLNDVLIPKLKALFTLSYAEVMLVQSAFFAAYFIVSIPAAALVRRIGYMRSASVGLLTMTAGCLLFVPASAKGIFTLFLFALFVLAVGITTVQVVANPLISMLGRAATASSRLTFAQAFNSLGTTIFPYVGSMLILGSLATVDPAKLSGEALDAFRGVETRVIVHTYLGLAIALLVLAAVVWLRRKALVETPAPATPILRAFNLLTRPRFAFGTLCIFLYVGGEVAIGSLIVSYLMQSSVFGVAAEEAGKPVLLGRCHGGQVHRRLCAALVRARQGACLRGGRRHRIADFFGALERNRFGVGAVVDRALQFHHVPDYFYAGERGSGNPRGRRFRRHLHGHRGRCHRTPGDRHRRGSLGPEGVAQRACHLLFRHSRLWRVRAPPARDEARRLTAGTGTYVTRVHPGRRRNGRPHARTRLDEDESRCA
jgi:MFS transporter, FHS family, L-fucose permease